METTLPAMMLRRGDRPRFGTGPVSPVVEVTRPFGSTMVVVLDQNGRRWHLNATTIVRAERDA